MVNPVQPAGPPPAFQAIVETHARCQKLTLGHMDVECPKCHAVHWKQEWLSNSSIDNPRFGTCCLSGKVELPKLERPPRELWELFDGTDPNSKHFLENIRAYNAAFAMASLGVNVDHSVNDGQGPNIFKIQGELHHRTGSLLPEENESPIYAQLYFYDPERAVQHRMNNN